MMKEKGRLVPPLLKEELMKKMMIALLAVWAVCQVQAADDLWLTDFAKAQAKAKEEKKLVFMDFNGSDWCPPCILLRKNVLSTPEFIDYAKTNLVLVDVDFPRQKEQPAAQKKANEALAEKHGVEVFPTVIVLNSEGKEVKRVTSYRGEDVKAIISVLDKLKKQG